MKSTDENVTVIAAVGSRLSATLRESSASLDWQVIEASQPAEALKAIRRVRAKVIIVEILPLILAGLELIRLLSGPTRTGVVVAVSALHTEALERDARAIGAACYVPFTTDVTGIVQAVNNILDRNDATPRRQARAREIRPIRLISSFPPPATVTGDGRKPNPSPGVLGGKVECERTRSN